VVEIDNIIGTDRRKIHESLDRKCPVSASWPEASTQPEPEYHDRQRTPVEQLKKNDGCHHRGIALHAEAT
jgi:hypothetical protein